MILTMKQYYSESAKLYGIKIINKIIKSRASDWDLYIYPLGILIGNKQTWEIIGVDEI